MKKTIALFLTLVLIILTAGCGGDTKDAEEFTAETSVAEITETTMGLGTTEVSTTENQYPEVSGNYRFTKENYPNMGGSLAALPLGEAVTSAVLGMDRDMASTMITFEGSTTDNYMALVDGSFDILLAYEPSEEAKTYAEENDFEYEMAPIGVDALVFICSKDNSVQSLTIDQIKSIYTGKTTNWEEVGGKNIDIIPYQRNKDSGSQTLFDKLINLGDKLMTPQKNQIVKSMIGLLEAVADYQNAEGALGYTVYYYLTNMETDKLNTSKILAVNGVRPSNETIGSGEYPLTNDFYVVISKDAPENSPERILYNWIKSEQGKQLVIGENYPVRES